MVITVQKMILMILLLYTILKSLITKVLMANTNMRIYKIITVMKVLVIKSNNKKH